jgi:hypothetical protein
MRTLFQTVVAVLTIVWGAVAVGTIALILWAVFTLVPALAHWLEAQ